MRIELKIIHWSQTYLSDRPKNMTYSKILLLASLVLGVCFATSCSHTDWRTADRTSMGLAPLPEEEKEAIVHVYGARAINWRGNFSLHCWIATKAKDADHYVTYHVMGFRLDRTGTSVVIEQDIPDRRWFGAEVQLIEELRGAKAEAAIPKIQELAENYPNAGVYRAWPGPNSNTFVSHIIRHTPELGVELPSNAIGKDWIDNGDLVGFSESGTGVQLSALGALGVTLGLAEGIEVNLLGMSFGVDFWRPALKLPFVGRLGFKDAPVY
ncbi:DUF3750 domain-containing protein [Pseudobdellovibrio exovorus]|uniref:DUF3750 domain-containing protein n=1 Tax=Pseudobdellovibrio exovorus JSS TaxID=1184267 RepID=M4VB85_9BACT|nr:DUF3750 domain-containing protein [Pseudobdellovibrio exovorus]AGH96652.1 hypothetical protein A11Q_2436 [Pseudobdellovibrio exovorus JSS]